MTGTSIRPRCQRLIDDTALRASALKTRCASVHGTKILAACLHRSSART